MHCALSIIPTRPDAINADGIESISAKPMWFGIEGAIHRWCSANHDQLTIDHVDHAHYAKGDHENPIPASTNTEPK